MNSPLYPSSADDLPCLVVPYGYGHPWAVDRYINGSSAGLWILETVIFRVDSKLDKQRALHHIYLKTDGVAVATQRICFSKFRLPVEEGILWR